MIRIGGAIFVALLVFALLVWWGPHDHAGQSYAPNLIASLLELTIGGVLVAWVVRWDRRRRLAPTRDAALLLAGRSLMRIIAVLADAYVEGTVDAPVDPPATIGELLTGLQNAVRHLDLTAEPRVSRGELWRDYMPRQFALGIGELGEVTTRFTEALEHRFVNAVVQIEIDSFANLLLDVPRVAAYFGPRPPRTLPTYLLTYERFSLSDRDLANLYALFEQRLTELLNAYNAIATNPIHLDERFFYRRYPYDRWGVSAILGY